MSQKNTVHPEILSISKPYKAVLLDAYGVFWSGNEKGLIPGALESMRALIESGKMVGILSNSSAPGKKEMEKIARHGIYKDSHYHFFLTSGDVISECLKNHNFPFPCSKKRYYSFCDPHPKFMASMSVFDGTEYKRTDNIKEADFIYISVPHIDGMDQTDPNRFRDRVKELVHSGLWMVCPNPDLYAHEGSPPVPVVRQGSIASLYEEAGGRVFYIGKPYPIVYEKAMGHFIKGGILSPHDILMVGDTPETDIQGANDFGMHSALIVDTGIFASRSENTEELMLSLYDNTIPKYFIKRLGRYVI